MADRIAVIGAGYAGLACAVELASAGMAVDVFEASRALGGRARAIELDDITVDNGAHILVGAYRETLRLMQKVGADSTALKRCPLHLEYPGHMKLAAPQLPAPLHLGWALLTAQGFSLADKLAAIRFMRAQQARGFRLSADMSAADLLAAHRQPERVRRFLWEPLCLAALNTPVAIASAQVFLNVLRDSLAADSAASDLLLPATDFSKLFPEPAAQFIAAHGGRVLRSTRITAIAKLGAGWTATVTENHGPYDHLVLAVAPYHLSKLLAPHAKFAALVRQVESFVWQPIVTCYLAYPATTLLPFPMVGVDGGHAQWLFDRGALCGQAGVLAAVISGDGPHQALSHADLSAAIHEEIVALLPGLRPPRRTWVIEEKRATFACTPGLERPPTATAFPNVWLAGDYVAGDYPATLEGAVRSGIAAADSILGKMPGDQP
ncbi:MAG: hydroxysqualene dehydroxylase HpnE [Rhodocyclaceae bacterium]|nr:hydroxysqualene dehydroxylase HpnE [Rhodocyclaceae bacterium]